MKERSQQLLSEVGENIDYMRSDVKNLSRYIVELEELFELEACDKSVILFQRIQPMRVNTHLTRFRFFC